MTNLNYITDKEGNKTHILLPLKTGKKITLEYLEDVQDIITYELLKDDESIDYIPNAEKLIKSKVKKNV